MFDLISIGDATIDNFIKIHDAEVSCTLDKTKCMLCVEYGSKIAVDKFTHLVGGNAAHNAIGGARLNLKTAIYVNVGSDYASKQIKDKLKAEKVNTRFVVVNEGMESNLSTVLTFKGERTIFAYHQPWEYQLPDLDYSKWIYFTSLSKSFLKSNLINELCLYLERTGAKLLYNPGTYQIQYGVKKYPRLLSLTQIFIVNIEEAKRVLGYKDTENIPVKNLLKGIADLGPELIVITASDKGSYGFDGQRCYFLGVFPVHVMEKTGAGDAYATGVLAGLFDGKDLKESMRWGAANSASVIGQIGPHGGLLTYDQMQQKLKQNSKITAKEI